MTLSISNKSTHDQSGKSFPGIAQRIKIITAHKNAGSNGYDFITKN